LGGVGARICRILAAAPAVALAAASLAWTGGAAAGGGLWPARDETLSEAAATRNKAEAARLIAIGQDPNRPWRVRENLLPGDQSRIVTPLEAAVLARRPDMAQMLIDYGASLDGEQLRRLRCSSERLEDRDVRAFLERLSPEPWPLCN
jgi:hypothetical protein